MNRIENVYSLKTNYIERMNDFKTEAQKKCLNKWNCMLITHIIMSLKILKVKQHAGEMIIKNHIDVIRQFDGTLSLFDEALLKVLTFKKEYST